MVLEKWDVMNLSKYCLDRLTALSKNPCLKPNSLGWTWLFEAGKKQNKTKQTLKELNKYYRYTKTGVLNSNSSSHSLNSSSLNVDRVKYRSRQEYQSRSTSFLEDLEIPAEPWWHPFLNPSAPNWPLLQHCVGIAVSICLSSPLSLLCLKNRNHKLCLEWHCFYDWFIV